MMTISKAVEILQDELLKDKEYHYAWQSNIAMSFIDAFPKDIMEYDKLHKLANEGAERFLRVLCIKTGSCEADKGE